LEFAWEWRWGIAIVLLCASAAAQVGSGDGQLPVLVYANAKVRGSVIDQAGIEVVRIFRAAGIEVRWVNCFGRDVGKDCQNLLDIDKLILNVLPRGKTAGESVYGDAFLAEDGTGKYADIFFDRISEAHHENGIDESRLLGAVAAHEIGHLLLGLRAHTWLGIMAPKWTGESLRQMGMGRLLFTSEQAARMRGRIRGYTSVAAYGVAGGPSTEKMEDSPGDRSYASALCLRSGGSYAYVGCERPALRR
jgi:hypothetical protein